MIQLLNVKRDYSKGSSFLMNDVVRSILKFSFTHASRAHLLRFRMSTVRIF